MPLLELSMVSYHPKEIADSLKEGHPGDAKNVFGT